MMAPRTSKARSSKIIDKPIMCLIVSMHQVRLGRRRNGTRMRTDRYDSARQEFAHAQYTLISYIM